MDIPRPVRAAHRARCRAGAGGRARRLGGPGLVREVPTAHGALTILISGDADNFTVRISIGKWLEHLVVAGLETLLLSDLFLLVDVSETAWNLEIEHKLAKQIESCVG